ncbi:MAG: peptide chain release factor N(5)-glutamine methyltransferase [Lachnospiraceae bacterium]|nr:peptide chain release factor N(5)-glutamine methyltransferase [Lachnospiraceae bacterium]
MRLDSLHGKIRELLEGGGVPDSRTDAMILLREIAGIEAAQLLAYPEREVEQSVAQQVLNLAERRAGRIPLQILLGRTDFMGLSFRVREQVLIPRPDTEILVEEALKDVKDGDRILDLCTGTGCILISLLHYSNECLGTGTDISREALALAGENADLLPEEKRSSVRFLEGDLFDALESGEKYDIIVSNPPYIARGEIPGLMPEVREFDPVCALDGGEDGMDFYRRIAAGAGAFLTPGGKLFLEIGCDQAQAVTDELEAAGFCEIRVTRDYGGNDRVVSAKVREDV